MAEGGRKVSRKALVHGYEPSDARVDRIVWVAPGLVLLIVVFGAGIWGMIQILQSLKPPERATAIETSSAPIPGPKLQVNPQADLAALREHESQILTNYGWVDRGRGIARIPIDRAMALLAEHGWPQTPPAPGGAPADAPPAREGRQP
ncbi:MAG: hypothetical protein JNM75_05980 [Rhodospirillales bacterium]|nr:hypothetical protein [Rhodospirillales bacterium]